MKSCTIACLVTIFLSAGAWSQEQPQPQGDAGAPPPAALPEQPPAPPPLPIPTGPEVKIVTSLGTISLTLYSEQAPATTRNFLRYAREGHFNGTAVYRVVPRFVIQMGSIDARGQGRPLHKPVPLETATGLRNVRGTVAMARADAPATGTAEFFINLGENLPLDPTAGTKPNTTGYAVFAQVTGGMDVLDAIAAVPLGGGYGPFGDAAPKKPIIIRTVTVTVTPTAKAKP